MNNSKKLEKKKYKICNKQVPNGRSLWVIGLQKPTSRRHIHVRWFEPNFELTELVFIFLTPNI